MEKLRKVLAEIRGWIDEMDAAGDIVDQRELKKSFERMLSDLEAAEDEIKRGNHAQQNA